MIRLVLVLLPRLGAALLAIALFCAALLPL